MDYEVDISLALSLRSFDIWQREPFLEKIYHGIFFKSITIEQDDVYNFLVIVCNFNNFGEAEKTHYGYRFR